MRGTKSGTNARGRSYYTELAPCPRCGRSAGQRRESEREVGRYFVCCAECGYAVSARNGYSMATRRWNRESKIRWEGESDEA